MRQLLFFSRSALHTLSTRWGQPCRIFVRSSGTRRDNVPGRRRACLPQSCSLRPACASEQASWPSHLLAWLVSLRWTGSRAGLTLSRYLQLLGSLLVPKQFHTLVGNLAGIYSQCPLRPVRCFQSSCIKAQPLTGRKYLSDSSQGRCVLAAGDWGRCTCGDHLRALFQVRSIVFCS